MGFGKHQVTLQDPNLLYQMVLCKIREESGLVIAVKPLADRLEVSFADVQDSVGRRVQVGIQAEVGSPTGIPIVGQFRPRDLYLKNGRHVSRGVAPSNDLVFSGGRTAPR